MWCCAKDEEDGSQKIVSKADGLVNADGAAGVKVELKQPSSEKTPTSARSNNGKVVNLLGAAAEEKTPAAVEPAPVKVDPPPPAEPPKPAEPALPVEKPPELAPPAKIEKPPAPPPLSLPTKPVEFSLQVNREPGEVFGLSFDGMDDVEAVVIEVKEGGVIDLHNKKANVDRQVKDGDCLLEVNGVRGTLEELIDEMVRGSALDIKFRRPSVWDIKVDGSDCLGLSLGHKESSTALFIGGIGKGAITTWNKANPHAEVRKGDRIISCNNRNGYAFAMIEDIQSEKGPLTLKIAR